MLLTGVNMTQPDVLEGHQSLPGTEQREDMVHKKQINQSLPEHVWLWQHSSEPRRKKIVRSKVQNTFIVHLSVWETIAREREGKYKHNIYLVSPFPLDSLFFNVFLLLWGAPRDGWVEESSRWYVSATRTEQSLTHFQSPISNNGNNSVAKKKQH